MKVYAQQLIDPPGHYDTHPVRRKGRFRVRGGVATFTTKQLVDDKKRRVDIFPPMTDVSVCLSTGEVRGVTNESPPNVRAWLIEDKEALERLFIKDTIEQLMELIFSELSPFSEVVE